MFPQTGATRLAKRHPATRLVLPAGTGSYATTPDSVANSILGDIDLRVDAAYADWTPAFTQYGISKFVTGQVSYGLGVLATGALILLWSEDGTNLLFETSTANPTVTDGSRIAYRGTLDVDDGGGNHVVTFYTAPTIGGAWTQLGAPVTTAGATSIFDSTSPLEAGGLSEASLNIAGTLNRAQVYNGINGTLAADFDPRRAQSPSRTFIASTGERWTIIGNAKLM